MTVSKYLGLLLISLALLFSGCNKKADEDASINQDPRAKGFDYNFTKTNVVRVVSGDAIYNRRCINCHGPQGTRSALNRSKIIGGWDTQKIIVALRGYKHDQGGQFKGTMKNMIIDLDDEEIQAVAKTISSFK
ncbi:MAG: c-type cytochrome [Sulfurospirillaceae bacterium]|nr:c-type cytochrome [Sulfurospirillaceae bacterium]